MTVLRKVYNDLYLEFHQSPTQPYLYNAYDTTGKRYEQNCPGWGWVSISLFESQLDELENWEYSDLLLPMTVDASELFEELPA